MSTRATTDEGPAAGIDPFRGLLPTSAQARSRDTVEACVAAAVALFDEGGEAAVTVEAVRDRSGVTTGSLYHHFGDLERLRVVARAVRSHRSIAEPVRVALDRYRAVTSAADMARVTRAQVVGRDTPEARAGVWALTDAIAAARDRPELRAVVTDVLGGVNDRMADVLAAHRDAGRMGPDGHPRSIMLFSRALAHVRLLDDLDPRPVPHRDWVAVACRIHDGLIDPAPLPPPLALTPERRAELGALLVSADLDATSDVSTPMVRMVARTRDLLVAGGPDLVSVTRLRQEQGVSAGWFHRTFGDRAGLLAAARLDLLERTLRAEVRSFGHLVAAVTRPEELVEAVAAWAVGPPGDETVRRMRWQRADLIVAARWGAALGYEAGRAIGAATDALVDITTAGQARGLIRPELAPRAVARAVQSMLFAPLLAEIDGTRVPVADRVATVRRGLLPLVA